MLLKSTFLSNCVIYLLMKPVNGMAAVCVVLQYEHHLLLQSLQRVEQARLDLTVVMLMVNLSCSHREHVLIMLLVELQRSPRVALFSLVSLFICTQGGRETFSSWWVYIYTVRTIKPTVTSKWNFYLEKSGVPTFTGLLILPLGLSCISNGLSVAALKLLHLCLSHL